MCNWERKAMRLGAVLLALGALVFVGVWAMNGFDFGNFARELSYNRVTHSPEGAFDCVDVTDVDANVRILPAADGKCSVDCDESGKRSYAVEVVDGALAVRREGDWLDNIASVNFTTPELTIYLPGGAYQHIRVTCTSGDVHVEGAGAAEMRVETASGDVTLSGLKAGAVAARTTSGGVALENVEMGNLDGESTSGAVRLSDSSASGDIRIHTVSGGIRLEGADAANYDLRTVSGGISGELLRGKVYSVRSVSGAIKVPDSVAGAGSFKASTTSGSVNVSVRK